MLPTGPQRSLGLPRVVAGPVETPRRAAPGQGHGTGCLTAVLSAQDSPTNKLLYAKEIPEYRKIVQRYYKQIQDMTPLSEQEMNAHLAEESRVRAGCSTGLLPGGVGGGREAGHSAVP